MTMFIINQFVLFCGQALKTIYCFLTLFEFDQKLSLYICWIRMLENCRISMTFKYELHHTPMTTS